MRPDEIITQMMKREHKSKREVSKVMGKSPRYLDPIVYDGRSPRVDTFAGIVDAMGYDLVARSRDDGFEFRVDPPPE